MPRAAVKKPVRLAGKRPVVKRPAQTGFAAGLSRQAGKGQRVEVSRKRVDAVIAAAERSGLMGEKTGRIGGRVSPALIEQAKKLTGIESDTELLQFALASVALEDDFLATFRKLKGTVDPSLDLEF
jgi:hypothetical protein